MNWFGLDSFHETRAENEAKSVAVRASSIESYNVCYQKYNVI